MTLGMKATCMTESPTLDPQFDRFVYAELCEHDETTPSVLSALARQSVDPWQLAARLTQMPKDQAVEMLTSIVQASDHKRWSPLEANEVAVRLIGLLPCQNHFGSAAHAMETHKANLMIWLMYGIFWGTLAIYAGNPQQAVKSGGDSSVTDDIISREALPSLQQPNTD